MIQTTHASSNSTMYGSIENIPLNCSAAQHHRFAVSENQTGYFDHITNLFFSAVQWIKQHLFHSCFSQEISPVNYFLIFQDLTQALNPPSNTSSEITAEYHRIKENITPIFQRALKSQRAMLIQNLEVEMERFQNLSSIPELGPGARNEVYGFSTYQGRKIGDVWDENRDVWNQHLRGIFLSIQPIYAFFKNSGYTKTEQEISDFMRQHPPSDEVRTFLTDHTLDPQYAWVITKLQSLILFMKFIASIRILQ